MRIGELAALTGVTPRTVRHYHHIGLLPEPHRTPGGYRVYGLRDAYRVVRVRRLTALGLSLDEARDVLDDESGVELREVLGELDAELARQEEAVRARRARVAELLAEAEGHPGLPTEGPVSPELTALFRRMRETADTLGGPEPDAAVRERELMALLEGAAPQGGDQGAWLSSLVSAFGDDPEAMAAAYGVYAELDALADADADDPRVGPLAARVVESLPEEVARLAAGVGPGDLTGAFADAFFADHGPAQLAVVRRVVELLGERSR
ncbi:DNA-binding transcriptional regulator, MerR family [Streptomyces zhaozhouensis]|uniref:DNA-binding transcriptional regulator, MerR family n=1 Tax=Streptomyces zhaozhouensis TaxID=1300267 RepID=A0A286DYR0_9ACTN|nr:MerR family transcriptional regulator [Streptomyces zhaozhouensis]SOD63807.1 DNA-binding transcriptional regulator, MerR family [Streptomyces zhaozhouensis]